MVAALWSGPKTVFSLWNSFVFYWFLKCSMSHISFSSLATCRSFCENRSQVSTSVFLKFLWQTHCTRLGSSRTLEDFEERNLFCIIQMHIHLFIWCIPISTSKVETLNQSNSCKLVLLNIIMVGKMWKSGSSFSREMWPFGGKFCIFQ